MDVTQEEPLQKAIQKAKDNPEKLDLSRSVSDPLFSAQQWKTLIPFITNNDNLRELRLNRKHIGIKDNNLCVDCMMGDESIQILMESLPDINLLSLQGRCKWKTLTTP